MKIHPLLAAAVSAAMAVACGGRKDGPVRSTSSSGSQVAPGQQALENHEQALMRVVQAIPEAPQADVYAGRDKKFSDVGFGTVTRYEPVREERVNIALKPAGAADAQPMIETKEGLDAGRRYTVLTLPDRDGSAKIDVVADDAEPPAAGKAKLRVINAAPQAGKVDVFAAGDPKRKALVGDIDYGATASYKEVEPGSVGLEVRPRLDSKGKGKTAALLTQQAPLEAGKMYTFVVASGSKPGKAVELIKIEDTVAPGAGPANADGVRELYPTGKQKAIEKESDESYEIHPDTDNLPSQPADQGKAPQESKSAKKGRR